jgi:hypothetical protein
MKIKTIFAALISCVSLSQAATVTVSDALLSSDLNNYHYGRDGNTTFVPFKTSNAQLMTSASTSKYWLGYFVGYNAEIEGTLQAASGADILALANDPSKFVPLGFGVSGLGANISANQRIGATGRVANSMSGVTYLDGTANASAVGGINRGTKLFLLMLNQTSLTESATTELGLFSASSWVIPASGTGTTFVNLKEVDTNAEVYFGSLGSLVLGVSNPVPEPAVGMLALGSLAFFMGRRRTSN